MAFELEALVGHLYIAGGRTIKTTPPGSLCEVAPKKAARGREIDTLFVLVLPSGTIAPNTFYEQMALMAAERYFSNGGSVTSALRDVYNTLNNNLYEHNASGRKHYEANMLMAVLRGTDLYVARAGAATLLLRQQSEIITVPEKLTDDDKLFRPPMGVQPIPEVEMTRFVVEDGTRMLIADASLVEITDAKIAQAFAAEDIEKLLDEFKLLVTLQVQMMAVEFVPPEKPVMVPAATGQSSAEIAAEIAAVRAKAINRQPVDVSGGGGVAIRRETPQQRLKRRLTDAVVGVARSIGHTLTAIGSLGGKLFGKDASPAARRRNSLIVAAAVVLIPAVLVSLVLLSWVANLGEGVYEECVRRANDASSVARTVPLDNRTSILTAWDATLRIVNECEALRPESQDVTLDTVRLEAQTAIDSLRGVTRRRTETVWVSPDSGANIRELVLNGLDIYALDSANSIVYRVQLNEDGTTLAGTPQPLQFMRLGARVEGTQIGRIIGIAFDDQRDRIVALDEGGVLVSCRPQFINQCEAQRLQGIENLRQPMRIELWQGNLYVLDTGSAQIWRFTPIGNTDDFANAPTEYYSGATRPPNLTNAVDFAIGSSATGASGIGGNVFVLYQDGTMTRHYGGEPQGFGFSAFPPGLETPDQATTQAMYLNDTAIFTGFYIVSRPTRTIYYTTTVGTFQSAYRVVNESLLERLNDVIGDPEQNIIYLASGNAIFAFRSDG